MNNEYLGGFLPTTCDILLVQNRAVSYDDILRGPTGTLRSGGGLCVCVCVCVCVCAGNTTEVSVVTAKSIWNTKCLSKCTVCNFEHLTGLDVHVYGLRKPTQSPGLARGLLQWYRHDDHSHS